MSVLPNNTDPLKDYVANGPIGSLPPLTLDGLVYNKVYAQTGVIDTIGRILTNKTGYTDPNTNIINGHNNAIVFNQSLETNWISTQDFGGPNSTPVILTYDLAIETDLNYITFDILNVPCFVEILYLDANSGNIIPAPGSSTFVVNGGSNIFTTDEFIRLTYIAPQTFSTLQLQLKITRTIAIQTVTNGIATNVAYSVGVQAFSVRLLVLQYSDIPSNTSAPTMGMMPASINTQNRFGFLENYSFANYPVNNMFTNDNLYWKSGPQPTSDSIVYFYACLTDDSLNPKTINRLYIDPLYSGCRFNIYFTTQSTNSGTIDPNTFTWTPIPNDFTLRKGTYEIPQTTATYLKFEFVKLVAEAYDLPFDSVPRTINVFPADVEEYYYNLENQIIDGNSVQYSYIGNNNNPQTITNTNINSSTLFGLSSNTVANKNSWPQLSALNDSQLGGNTTTVGNNTNSYVFDPTVSYKTVDANGNYNGVAYNQFLQRRFPNVQVHNYTQTTFNQVWHQAYFTGIQYLTAFYEQLYDDIRITPQNLIPNQSDGFVASGTGYIVMDPDDQAYTPWFPTIETFNSFNFGSIDSDWSSFLTDDQVLMNDPNNLNSNYFYNAVGQKVGNLGTSSIISVTQNIPGVGYSISSPTYSGSRNLLYYDYANFLNNSNWSTGSGTTITPTTVQWVNGNTINQQASGTASGITVSGGSFTAIYTWTIPGVGYGGAEPWKLQFAAPGLGNVGFGEYNQLTSGTNYYFTVNSQVSGTASGISKVNGTLSASTRFYNSVSNTIISGTTVSGNTLTYVSGTSSNIGSLAATNYTTSGIPAGTIQLVISGNNLPNYKLFQLGVFPTPSNSWITPQDRANMRISALMRILLPFTNNGAYRFSLNALDDAGNKNVLVFHDFAPMMVPLNTWYDVELTGFTAKNYTQFFTEIEQLNGGVNEVFYVAANAPFYHPLRYEYTTFSGSTYPNNYHYITGNVNNPNFFISTTSGLPASGIQMRMTALDPNIFISGMSIVPYYKSNPYYAEMNMDYIGNSKTNELESRTVVDQKPYFQNTSLTFPERFQIPIVAGPSTYYVTSQFIYNSI